MKPGLTDRIDTITNALSHNQPSAMASLLPTTSAMKVRQSSTTSSSRKELTWKNFKKTVLPSTSRRNSNSSSHSNSRNRINKHKNKSNGKREDKDKKNRIARQIQEFFDDARGKKVEKVWPHPMKGRDARHDPRKGLDGAVRNCHSVENEREEKSSLGRKFGKMVSSLSIKGKGKVTTDGLFAGPLDEENIPDEEIHWTLNRNLYGRPDKGKRKEVITGLCMSGALLSPNQLDSVLERGREIDDGDDVMDGILPAVTAEEVEESMRLEMLEAARHNDPDLQNAIHESLAVQQRIERKSDEVARHEEALFERARQESLSAEQKIRKISLHSFNSPINDYGRRGYRAEAGPSGTYAKPSTKVDSVPDQNEEVFDSPTLAYMKRVTWFDGPADDSGQPQTRTEAAPSGTNAKVRTNAHGLPVRTEKGTILSVMRRDSWHEDPVDNNGRPETRTEGDPSRTTDATTNANEQPTGQYISEIRTAAFANEQADLLTSPIAPSIMPPFSQSRYVYSVHRRLRILTVEDTNTDTFTNAEMSNKNIGLYESQIDAENQVLGLWYHFHSASQPWNANYTVHFKRDNDSMLSWIATRPPIGRNPRATVQIWVCKREVKEDTDRPRMKVRWPKVGWYCDREGEVRGFEEGGRVRIACI